MHLFRFLLVVLISFGISNVNGLGSTGCSGVHSTTNGSISIASGLPFREDKLVVLAVVLFFSI